MKEITLESLREAARILEKNKAKPTPDGYYFWYVSPGFLDKISAGIIRRKTKPPEKPVGE